MSTPKPTLFLDRDGVLNRRIPGHYVRHWSEFEFLPGVLKALSLLSSCFDRIVVVTNQLGVSKQLMSQDELDDIHHEMLQNVVSSGGRIDKVYACTDRSACRKPQTGMAWQAKRDFPEIDFKHSVMVGDSISDMQFGFALGMYTVLIPSKEEEREAYQTIEVDQQVSTLLEYAEGLLS